MKFFTDLDKAREWHAEDGGWLLVLGDGVYAVTDDLGIVRDLRQHDYANWQERIQRAGFDESQLQGDDQ